MEITLISPQREEGYLEILTILLETITRIRVGEECLVILVVLERQTTLQVKEKPPTLTHYPYIL